MYYYSKSSNAFYIREIHGNNIPSDTVEVTDEEHQRIFTEHYATGKQITSDSNGRPILVDAPPLPYTNLRAAAYPSIGDQLDALYHAGVFPADMAAKIKEVKDKYPK